jgi:hypothetical protein
MLDMTAHVDNTWIAAYRLYLAARSKYENTRDVPGADIVAAHVEMTTAFAALSTANLDVQKFR